MIITCLNFTFDSVVTNKKSDFYQQSETWPNIYDEGYIHQFQRDLHLQNSLAAAKALSSKISSYGTPLK